MNGLINVQLRGPEIEYTPSCGCGWCGDIDATIEWAELSLLSHFSKAHHEEQAA